LLAWSESSLAGLVRVVSLAGLVRVVSLAGLVRVVSLAGLVRVVSLAGLVRVVSLAGLVRVVSCWPGPSRLLLAWSESSLAGLVRVVSLASLVRVVSCQPGPSRGHPRPSHLRVSFTPTRASGRPGRRRPSESVEDGGELPAGPCEAVGRGGVRLHHALRRVLSEPPPAREEREGEERKNGGERGWGRRR
jgi:hypothetical protein